MGDKKWFIFFVVLFSLFCIFEVSAQYGDYFGYEGQSVIDLYREYASWFDFFIFLIIFLGLGRAIFGEHFKGAGGRGVYIGIGIFLALALLIWEEQADFSLIEFMGPWVLVLFFMVIIFLTFMFIVKAGGGVLLAASITYLIFFVVYTGMINYLDVYYFNVSDWIYGHWGFDIEAFHPLLWVGVGFAIVGVIVGGIMTRRSRRRRFVEER